LLVCGSSAAMCGADAPAPAVEATTADAAALATIGNHLPDIAFTDIAGHATSLTALSPAPAIVIASIGTDCPISRKYAPRLVELERAYRDRGVVFILVDCAEDGADALRAAAARHGFVMPVVDDRDRRFALALRVRSTTEVFVLDERRQLAYRGAIDDRHGLTFDREERAHELLTDALDAVLAGKPVAIPSTPAPGCEIPAAAEADIEAITWSNQVSRILQRSCQECHHPDAAAPFSLITYEQAKRKRAVIRRAVSERSMPPWYADPAVGGHWANDRRLSDHDLKTILAWVAADCPEGDPHDAPAPRTWTSEWVIGTPDAIIQIEKPVTVPASGTMGYQYLYVKTDYPEDRWVQAVEMRPTAPEVVHHAQTFVTMDGKNLFDTVRDGSGRLNCYFAAMVPGDTSQTYPAGVARLLPKGATLMFEIHYVPNGVETTDQMRLGLIFATEKPQHEVHSFDIRNNAIAIPPGAVGYTISAQYTMPTPARLLSFQPHMHLRGRSFAFDLIMPDQSVRPLLLVPSWDFRWQLSYHPDPPVDVPAGATIRVTGTYDNSAANPANPDPKAFVRGGGETTDEMLVGFGEWHALSAPSTP
nr:redoxin family protein [Planctomycetota bacterium]